MVERAEMRPYRKAPFLFKKDLLKNQEGRCAICGSSSPRLFVLDHDHRHSIRVRGRRLKTYRGVLCEGCNLGLGHFCDSPELLRRAADYLEFPRTPRFPRLCLSLSESKIGNCATKGRRCTEDQRKRMSIAQKRSWKSRGKNGR